MGGIFSVIGERQANFTHECFLSMIEIYNENIRDLLNDTKEAATGKRYEIMRDSLVGMYVKVAGHPNPNPNPTLTLTPTLPLTLTLTLTRM